MRVFVGRSNAHVDGVVAKVGIVVIDTIERELSVAVQFSSFALEVHPYARVRAKSVETHCSVCETRVGSKGRVRSSVRHGYVERGFRRRQTEGVGFGVGFSDGRDGCIERQVGAQGVGVEREVELVDVQPRVVDEGLCGTALTQTDVSPERRNKRTERIEHREVGERSEGLHDCRVADGFEKRLEPVDECHDVHRRAGGQVQSFGIERQ